MFVLGSVGLLLLRPWVLSTFEDFAVKQTWWDLSSNQIQLRAGKSIWVGVKPAAERKRRREFTTNTSYFGYLIIYIYSRSLSNATSSNAILESTLIPFSFKNIWSTLFFQHFPWIMLIFGPLNQRCSRKSQHCSNFLEQWKFPWAMLIFYWTTLI